MRRTAALLALLALLLTLFPMATAAAPSERAASTRVIVVFDDDVTNPAAAAADLAGRHGFTTSFVYRHALKGFAAAVPAAAVDALARDPRIAAVELDQLVRLDAQTVPTGIHRTFASTNPNIDIDGSDDHRVDVDVAIIDTGIDLDHPDLNVVASTNCTGGGPFRASCGSGGDDDNGHGTHVAGTVAALDNDLGVVGMAPGARLHAVKVLRADGSGYLSWVTAGIDWVTARAGTIEVANMSLGCECSSSAMDQAIAGSVDAGVAYAVAAGNSDADASTHSPANHPDVLTVSALADFDGKAGALGSPTCRNDEDDTLANFSNFGGTIDIAAPGVCILSSVPGGGYDTFSGTSMASPHAAGGLALLASRSNPGNETDVKNLYGILTSEGNLDWTDDSGDGVKERLLDVSDATVFAPVLVAGGGGGGGGDEPPAEGISLSVRAYKVKGVQHADLTWSGATSANVDVWRNGSKITTTANDGAYTDNIGSKGGGSYTYKICEAGTSTCSNEATASF
jgi:subtilisin